MRLTPEQRRWNREIELNSESIAERAYRRSRNAVAVAAYSAAAAALALAALIVSRIL